MSDITRPIRQIAIIGTGVIGASWAAPFLAKGLARIIQLPSRRVEKARVTRSNRVR
jgi:3-hydroxyacyl-CoA dehydrogenase